MPLTMGFAGRIRMVYPNDMSMGKDDFLATTPGRGMVQARYLKGFATTIRHLGGDPRHIFELHGLNPTAFDDPDRHIDCVVPLRMMEYCSLHLADPLFGVRLADYQGPDAFGCLTVAARAAPNFRQALQVFVNYLPVVISPEGKTDLVESRSTAELRWRTDFDLSSQSHYHGLLLFLKTMRMLGRDDFRPLYATLNFKPEGRLIEELQDRIGCRIHGASSTNAIAFPLEVLDLPIPTSNRMLLNVLLNQLERLRGSTSKPAFVEQVEAYVRAALPAGNCTVRHCSNKLGTSIRTLQKRLAEQEIIFSDIVEKQRVDIARQALRTRSKKLSEVAYSLGYADQTSFGRAFKRWTGFTPKEFRAQSSKLS
jgi:AraC-like DNA-binding protein